MRDGVLILQYIDKDRLLDYLHKTVIFSGRTGSPTLKVKLTELNW